MSYSNMTGEEILMSDAKSSDLLNWMKLHPNEQHKDVAERFNILAAEEMRQYIISVCGDYDTEMHYDFDKKL